MTIHHDQLFQLALAVAVMFAGALLWLAVNAADVRKRIRRRERC